MASNESFYHSPAAHVEQLDRNLPHASGGDIMSLLSASSILPESVKHGNILPAVVYGADPYRIEHPSGGHRGVVDLRPAEPDLLDRTLYEDYFNPHGGLKRAVESAHYAIAGVGHGHGRREHKGTKFHHPAYIIGAKSGKYLFTEMSDDDLEQRQSMFEPLAEAYGIGVVAVGNQVIVGNENIRLPKIGLPAIVREIGQTIMHIPYTESAKSVLLQEVVKTLEANKSPDYRRVPAAKKTRRSA